MQRLIYLVRTSRIAGVQHLTNNTFLLGKEKTLYNTSSLVFKRCLASQNKGSKDTSDMNIHADLYKPSTATEETHVPDDLKDHHQPPETINTNIDTSAISRGKVWSAQNSDNIHVASLNRNNSTTFVPKSTENGSQGHQTTVHSTKGGLNIADPFKTQTLQPETTPAKLAEAAAASAFEPFAPDTPLTTAPTAEAVFAPKISSTDVYSATASPTAHFETSVSPPPSNESVKYAAATKSKVYGGQDTSADTKKRPKENPFELGQKNKPGQAK